MVQPQRTLVLSPYLELYDLVDFSFIYEELVSKYCPDNGRTAIDPSSLTKFRKLRLKDSTLLDMLIGKTVQIAVKKGIIKSKTIIMDSTHTKPDTIKKAAWKSCANYPSACARSFTTLTSPCATGSLPN